MGPDKLCSLILAHWREKMGGAHWDPMWHLTREGIYFSFMPDYAQKCWIRSQNGTNQILAKLEHIFGITQNFIKNLLNIQ